MGKGIKRQAKQEKDFKKQRIKVGKTLKKAQNETTVNVKVAKLAIPQAYGSTEAGEGEQIGQATLPEVVRQLAHHNVKVRRSALQSLSVLLQREGEQFTRDHVSEVLAATVTCLSDDEKMIRASFIALFEEVLQVHLSEEDLRSFLPVLMANVRSAASHLHIGCRNDALQFLKVLVAHCALIISEDHMPAVLNLFDGLLSQKHRETSLKAQSVSAVAASVAALHHILLCTCRKAKHDDNEQSEWLSSSGYAAKASGAWKVNKPVKLLIQIPGILQQAANGVDVLKGKRKVQEITESLSTQDIVDVSDSLIQRLFFCWDTCSPGEEGAARGEEQATSTCLLQTLQCISMLLAQLPCSNTGSDRRREVIFNRARVFAHDRLLPIFPNLPDAQKQSDASTAKLNQCVALLLLQLDPWLCVPHTGRAARKGHRQQQQQQQQLCTGISQGAEAAVDHLVYTAVRLGQALLLQSQGGDRGNPTHGDCRMMKQGSDGTPLLLSVQRLMEYAVHVLGAVGGSTKGSRKGKKGRSEDTTASELSTALQVALKLISQGGGMVQKDVEASLSALFKSATSESKLGSQALFLKCLCEQQQQQDVDVHSSTLKEYGLALAHRFSKARIEDAKHAVPLLEALLCMCRMHVFAEESDSDQLLQSLQHFALFFQHSEGSTDTAKWCEKARVAGARILCHAEIRPSSDQRSHL